MARAMSSRAMNPAQVRRSRLGFAVGASLSAVERDDRAWMVDGVDVFIVHRSFSKTREIGAPVFLFSFSGAKKKPRRTSRRTGAWWKMERKNGKLAATLQEQDTGTQPEESHRGFRNSYGSICTQPVTGHRQEKNIPFFIRVIVSINRSLPFFSLDLSINSLVFIIFKFQKCQYILRPYILDIFWLYYL